MILNLTFPFSQFSLKHHLASLLKVDPTSKTLSPLNAQWCILGKDFITFLSVPARPSPACTYWIAQHDAPYQMVNEMRNPLASAPHHGPVRGLSIGYSFNNYMRASPFKIKSDWPEAKKGSWASPSYLHTFLSSCHCLSPWLDSESKTLFLSLTSCILWTLLVLSLSGIFITNKWCWILVKNVLRQNSC